MKRCDLKKKKKVHLFGLFVCLVVHHDELELDVSLLLLLLLVLEERFLCFFAFFFLLFFDDFFNFLLFFALPLSFPCERPPDDELRRRRAFFLLSIGESLFGGLLSRDLSTGDDRRMLSLLLD